ncbi:hypothetical protein CEY15_07095 [Dietzia natronolimnaea]|uniref:Uncharacterized protein n=1 Tax=Dietzia natronolimnaea TaxID=161920 RepID=A0A2A2WRJ4_9ACTN|nr:hypothetical protein [Dietzia natronolimnaea]PAY23653.1 hypothetical protein CEY15_07095 [Dietzia natronolimnaea]
MSDFERNKDQVQAGVQAGASLVGRIAVIITDAVGSIAKEIGDFVTDGIEMREAARAARLDEHRRSPMIDLDGIEDGELQG